MTTMIPAWDHGTLVPVEKLEVHRTGLRHLAVSVFVISGQNTLIQRRAAGKYHTPGLWANTCCTHPLWDEAPEACAARRLWEELGLTGLDLSYRDRIEYRADVGGGLIEHEVVDLFVAYAPTLLQTTPNPEEVAEARWVDIAALQADVARNPDLYTPWLRIYLAEHGGRIFDHAMTA